MALPGDGVGHLRARARFGALSPVHWFGCPQVSRFGPSHARDRWPPSHVCCATLYASYLRVASSLPLLVRDSLIWARSDAPVAAVRGVPRRPGPANTNGGRQFSEIGHTSSVGGAGRGCQP
ncbi:hypothetical protein FMEAI12_4600028 [Parafrankia sp. Ea1.12]|nr:hypothetical protein FMEAI12_4600028 [Parafrankia sp. Ea1.12]